jgi:magnesium chelatase accessory protein
MPTPACWVRPSSPRKAGVDVTRAPLEPPPARLPADWPHRSHSHTVTAAGLAWHVQSWPSARADRPWLVLLHGTGASTHSWAGLAPLLAARFQVLTLDLPGHAFTQRPRADGLSLPGMAALLAGLLKHLAIDPVAIVGHSAGAAVAARLVLDGGARPRVLISLNGAWFPPGGADGWWYAPAAKLLALNPVAPWLFSWHAARPATLKRLLAGTGSTLDTAGQARYAQLAANVRHVAAVLAMMASWDLSPLQHDLPKLAALGCTLHLVAADRDGAVPPGQAQAVATRVPGAQLHRLPGLGHLAHEEAPALVAGLITGCVAPS